jgi:hypothetical protein
MASLLWIAVCTALLGGIEVDGQFSRAFNSPALDDPGDDFDAKEMESKCNVTDRAIAIFQNCRGIILNATDWFQRHRTRATGVHRADGVWD